MRKYGFINEKAQLFYDLWIQLLDYVNQKYRLRKDYYGMNSPKGLPLDVVRDLSIKLWENVAVIDEYLAENASTMSEAHMTIVKGWKKVVHGKFVVENLNAKSQKRIKESL